MTTDVVNVYIPDSHCSICLVIDADNANEKIQHGKFV